MTQPTFPLICITKGKYLDLIPAESYFSKVATSALIDPSIFDGTFLFDKTGNVWTYKQVSSNFRNNIWTKFLAKTFYNPLLEAQVIWKKVGSYHLDELKDKLKTCVDKDDDIITQFEEADIIKSSIEQAMTFDNVQHVLNKYVFDVDEKELWKEQERRPK